MLLFCAITQYGYLLPGLSPLVGMPFNFTRHTTSRILFLLPIAYAGFAFGRAGGISASIASILIMVPGVLISPARADAAMEVTAVILVGGLIGIWFEAQEREKTHHQQAHVKLEAAQERYQYLVQQLRENQSHLAALNSISEISTQSLELTYILNNVMDKILEVMDLDVGWIYLLDRRAGVLDLAVTRGLVPRVVAGMDRIALGEGFNGRVAESGQPLLVNNVSDDPRLTRAVVREERLHTQLVVPLQSKGFVLGTLGVASRGVRQLAQSEMDLLSAIGNQIGVAVENARLYQEQRAIAEQLQASEESLRLLFENANDAIFVRDQGGRITNANEAAASLTGRRRQELVGAQMADFLTRESVEALANVQAKLQAGEPFHQPLELTLVRADGKEVPIEATASALSQGDQPVGFQYIARDVTQQRQLQETMRFYARQVTQAQEEERKRVARELHDDTAQELVALSRRIDDTVWSDGQLSTETMKRLEELRTMTDKILDGVRRFSRDLRPSILDDLGLLPALEWLTTDLSRQSGIEADLKVVNEPRRLPPETELVLFRIIQEALSNVRKHSGATRVEMTVEFGESRVRMMVRDNGRGFDPQKVVMGDLVSTGKLGLIGMNERAQLLGGTAVVESQPGQGTTVTVEVAV
ncbi:MAG: PAS domain S-box protein [Chloroflexi bacterium]|nr:PAS domain S-box protein [Chloroflexota bacterium]